MKIIIKDVGYKRGYVTGPYLQESAGANADIVLEGGEDQEEAAIKALNYLKGITDKFHAQAHPGEDKTGGGETQPIGPQTTVVIDYGRHDASPDGVISYINRSQTLEELKSYKLLAGTNKDTYNAYCQRLKMLSNGNI